MGFVEPDSPADRAGIRIGDRLVRANGVPVRDVIDYMYSLGEDFLTLEFERGEGGTFSVELPGDRAPGLSFDPPRPRTCRNRCLFCFVSQLPRGLRKTLYVRDEDFRLSFLCGNYVTLANISKADKERILEQRLSPLYVSVHSTDPGIRGKLLGRPDTPPILPLLHDLVDAGISIHAQIVLCPGINDGANLEKTVRDLSALYPGIESLAVVPVGLTRYHRGGLTPVDPALARRTLSLLTKLRKKNWEKMGDPFVHPSDEFFLRAGLPVPPAEEYAGFPQLENGVGLIRDFLDRLDALKKLPSRLVRKTSVIAFTGLSFLPFLRSAAEGFQHQIKNLSVDVVGVENRFLGGGVTVAGLLSGRDIMDQLAGKKADALLVPSVMLRDGNGLFLDDVDINNLEENLGMPAIVIEPTPEGFLMGIRKAARRDDRQVARTK